MESTNDEIRELPRRVSIIHDRRYVAHDKLRNSH
jgi:hypothetical protein